MAKVERSSQAEHDLIEIWLYIASENLAAADKLLDQIESICKMLARSPRLGRLREELAPGIRSFPVGDYLVFYRAAPAGIVILRVLSGYRDLERLLP